MRNAVCLAVLLIIAGTAAGAESGGLSHPETGKEVPSNAFADLNGAFIRTYSGLAELNQKATRPILITSGASWELLCEDGSTRVLPPANPVEMQLKAVSHVLAYLYSIAERHWRNPDDPGWLALMDEAQRKLDLAIEDVDRRSWSSNAWPGQEAKLQSFIRDSLTMARDFAATSIARKDVTAAQFTDFATRYTPAIRATFYLNSLSNAVDVIAGLKQWKQEMGSDAWQRMRVIVAAGKGRSTAGITKDTNPAVAVLTSVMSAESIKSNVMMAPAAVTNDEALGGLALALTSNKLADVFARNDQAGWFYTSLKQPDMPVALEPVRNAVADLIKGDAKDPVLGLGPRK